LNARITIIAPANAVSQKQAWAIQNVWPESRENGRLKRTA
jgi:hypothetical protein